MKPVAPKSEVLPETVAEWIEALSEAYGIPFRRFAKDGGYTTQSLYNWRHGTRPTDYIMIASHAAETVVAVMQERAEEAERRAVRAKRNAIAARLAAQTANADARNARMLVTM